MLLPVVLRHAVSLHVARHFAAMHNPANCADLLTAVNRKSCICVTAGCPHLRACEQANGLDAKGF